MTLPTLPSDRSDPPGGLSIATATALLNSSMAKIARPGAQLALPTPQLPEPNPPVPPSLTPAHTSPPRSAIVTSPMPSANSPSNSSEDSSQSSYEPQTSSALWSQKEADLFIRSARRRGNDYPAILADLEAAGHYGRTVGAVKTRYNRLRRAGVFDDLAMPCHSNPLNEQGAQASGSSSCPHTHSSSDRAPAIQRPRGLKYHRWTAEEKRVVLRIGNKHHKSPNKMAAVYKEWKEHFPSSRLGETAVLSYYHMLRRKALGDGSEEEGEEEEDEDAVSEAGSSSSFAAETAIATGPSATTSSRTPRRAAAASSSSKEARSLCGVSGRNEARQCQPWNDDELDALDKVYRARRQQKAAWTGSKPLYKAYRKLMPRTKRSQNAVGKKYLRLYAGSACEGDSDSPGSESSEAEEDESVSDADEQEGDSTVLTEPGLEHFSQPGVARRQKTTKTPAPVSALTGSPRSLNRPKPFGQQDRPTATYALQAQANLPPLHSSTHTTSHSFSRSFPPASNARLPALNLLTTVLPDGVLFENAVGLGIAIYSPISFKIFTPQQTATLGQAAGCERPAFAFIVEAGGAVQTVVAPQGTTTSVRMVRDAEGLGGGGRGGGGEDSGGAGRMGVEAALCAVDGYKVTVVTWL